MAATEYILGYISAWRRHRDMILVAMPMFSGSMNPMKLIIWMYVMSSILVFKMAAIYAITNYISPYLSSEGR